MASGGSVKSGLNQMRNASLRNVSVRGFETVAENLAEQNSNGDLDEAYIAAARAATAKLMSATTKPPAGKPPVRSDPARGRSAFRESSARVAGLFTDLSPDSARAIMDPSPQSPDNTQSNGASKSTEPVPQSTPISVLTPSASAKSDTSSEGEMPSPEKQAEAAPEPAPAEAPVAEPKPPSEHKIEFEFIRLEEHDQAMGMASLALTAKNIALGAMVTETDSLREQVELMSPKGKGQSKAHGNRGGDDSRTNTTNASNANQSQVSTSAGDKNDSASTATVVTITQDNTAELERMRLEIKRLELALKKEQQACFTLRAERVAWRSEKEEMEDEMDQLREGAASVGKMLSGDAEDTAYETLTVLSHALRGEDLSFDAPGVKSRCEEVAKSGGVVAVLGAMAAHGDSERVQAAGAECLRRMAESSDEARQILCQNPEELLGQGSVPVLIRAMTENPDSPEIAESAGSVLAVVAKSGEEGKKMVGEEGKKAMAEASKNFPEVSYYEWLVSWF
ncbi:hypothetical protein OAD67_02565 [bacterium]|nr:hypothetical protein [bacterium]MDC1215239.1 hypothetical protein [bacterium]|tara:strand:+ start:1147 stop:2670 length:1524 start_codon:yes stop_codon:yes gene_type:complete